MLPTPRRRLASVVLAACVAWAAAGRLAGETAGNRVLLIHDGARVVQPLADYLKVRGGLDVILVDQAHLPPDWSGYRAVLGYIHFRLLDPTELAIIDYTKRGGRFVALHHMISSAKAENRYFLDFLGIQLDNPKFSRGTVVPGVDYGWYNANEKGVEVTLVNLNPSHFITSHDVRWSGTIRYRSSDSLAVERDYPAIVVPRAEAYLNHKFTDGREKTVLCGFSYTDPRTHALFQQDRSAWFKSCGAGRVFYFQSGHFIEEYRDPNIDQMILNAIVWDGR